MVKVTHRPNLALSMRNMAAQHRCASSGARTRSLTSSEREWRARSCRVAVDHGLVFKIDVLARAAEALDSTTRQVDAH